MNYIDVCCSLSISDEWMDRAGCVAAPAGVVGAAGGALVVQGDEKVYGHRGETRENYQAQSYKHNPVIGRRGDSLYCHHCEVDLIMKNVPMEVTYVCSSCGDMYGAGFEYCCLCDPYVFYACELALGLNEEEKRRKRG